ncbi:MAG: hypothetical protein ACXW3Z_04035 [Limisphaerales bacterium]
MRYTVRLLADSVVVAALAATHIAISGAEAASVEQRLNPLKAQNLGLQQELGAPKQLIEDLKSRPREPAAPDKDFTLDTPPLTNLQFGRFLRVKGLPQY